MNLEKTKALDRAIDDLLKDDRPVSYGGILSYSTYRADAWLVVDWLNRHGYEVIIACDGINLAACMVFRQTAAPYPPKDTFLHLPFIDAARKCVRVQARGVAKAICLAALAINGQDITEYAE